MDLHSVIMNIQVDDNKLNEAIGNSARTLKSVPEMIEQAYRLGHRDARHIAAELALSNEVWG